MVATLRMNSPLQPHTQSQLRMGIYRHFKGGKYHLIDTVKHSESGEELVLYRCLYGDRDLWVRPKAMFFETVDVDGVPAPRFEFIAASSEDDDISP